MYNDLFFFPQGARVIAAEPLPSTFKALQTNIALHHSWCTSENIPCAAVTALQVGLGDDSCLGTSASFSFYPNVAGWGTLTKFESPDSIFSDMDAFINNALDDEESTALSFVQRKLGLALRKVSPSLYKAVSRAAVKQLMAAKTIIECPMTTISEIIEKQNVEKVILLKVDTERGELGVLKGVRQEHWNRIEQAALEVHEENLNLVLDILKLKGKFENIHTMQTADLKNTSIFMVFAYR
jgi:FkbM family methyltransferase